ncbi:MAG: insulinase family protein, partial [Planctomycetales bacterium]
GSVQSITDLTSGQMRAYHQSHYLAGNIVLAVAGKYEWEPLLELVTKHCSDWPTGTVARSLPEPHPQPAFKVIRRESSLQEHAMLVSPACSGRHPLRFAAEILSVIVGDDSGSRLYWDLVEPGLVESAELSYNEYDGCGAWMSYFSCEPDLSEKILDRVGKIFAEVNKKGITAEELERAKNKVCSRIVLRSERPMGRLGSLGNNWIYRQEYRTVGDDLQAVKSVTLEQIGELLKSYPLGEMTTVMIGPREKVRSVSA